MVDVSSNYSLKEINTFGVSASASLYAAPDNLEGLSVFLEEYDYQKLPLLILGEGSNILFKSDYQGLILRPRIRGIEVLEEDEKQVTVRVGAAENWDNWVSIATERGWFGLENLSLIPGSVGSAPVQNIGAYGVELKDHLAWVEAWDLKYKKEVLIDRKACNFAYRSSIFKNESRGRYIITRVVFKLGKIPRLQLAYGNVGAVFEEAGGCSPLDLRNIIIAIRKQKLPDPATYGNAGSYFKNPLVEGPIFKCIRVDYPDIPNYSGLAKLHKIPAAWLIEKAGWKGKRIGNVGTWPMQPLVIVNYGGASGLEIFDFSEQIRSDVDRKFGIDLEREVNVV